MARKVWLTTSINSTPFNTPTPPSREPSLLGLVYVLNPAQIWAAYDTVPPPTAAGGVRSLTRDQLLAGGADLHNSHTVHPLQLPNLRP